MSKEVEALVMQVAENGNLIDAAIVFINGVADRIDASGGDEEKLAALTAELRVKDLALGQALAAGTPAQGVVAAPTLQGGATEPGTTSPDMQVDPPAGKPPQPVA